MTGVSAFVLLVSVACQDQAPGPTPTTINVNSVLDSILAVGKTVSLTAAVKDATGADISGLNLTWSSSNSSALTVSGAGLVSAVAAGNATISAQTGGITGTLRMRAVQADLTTVTTLSGDAYATALITAVTSGKRPAVQTQWAKCASGASSGGVVALIQCGTGVAAEATSATDAGDKALISILQLYSDDVQRRLGL